MKRFELRAPAWLIAPAAGYVALSVALAPGWLFYDSATQWGWARSLVDRGWPAALAEYGITSGWPIANTLLKLPFAALRGGPWLYSALQAMATIAAVVGLTHALRWRGRRVAALVVLATPATWTYAVFHSSDTLTALALCGGLALVLGASALSSRRTAAVVALAVVAALVRYTSLPAALGLSALAAWRTPGPRRAIVVTMAMGWLAIAGALLGARVVGTTAWPRDTSADGLLMRLVELNHRLGHAELDAQIAPFVARPHDTLGPGCLQSGIWCEEVQQRFDWPYFEEHTPEIPELYVRAMLTHPWDAFVVHARFASYALGLAQPLDETEVGHGDVPVPFAAVAMREDGWREAALSAHRASIDVFWGALARPWLMAVLAFVTLWLKRTGPFAPTAFAILMTSHAAPFAIASPASDFRYMWPITLVSYCIVSAGVCDGVARRLARGRANGAA